MAAAGPGGGQCGKKKNTRKNGKKNTKEKNGKKKRTTNRERKDKDDKRVGTVPIQDKKNLNKATTATRGDEGHDNKSWGTQQWTGTTRNN